jgi:hypothetical protein
MTKVHSTLKGLSLLVFMLALTSLAHAQATRTWVSGVGDDVNPCSRTAPCKTFAGAISKTFINGEIDVLDPGGFGTINITKSLTIDGGTGSGWGSILGSNTNGVTVNLTDVSGNDPQHTVILRHLSINGTGSSGTVGTRTGINGINYIRGDKLIVDDCVIFNFGTTGIKVNLVSVGNGSLDVENSKIEGNQVGYSQLISGGTFNSSFNNCVFSGNTGNAVQIDAGTSNVSNSEITNNGTGMVAQGSVGSVLNADNNTVVNNTNAGIQAANGFGTVRLNNNAVHRNGTGLSNSGTMQSCANNKVYGNSVDVSGATSAISPGSCTQ